LSNSALDPDEMANHDSPPALAGFPQPNSGIQDFWAHRAHQPAGLMSPSTSLQVLDSAMKCTQSAQVFPSLGWGWYCTLACDTFAGPAGAADSMGGGAAGAAISGAGAGGGSVPAVPASSFEQPSNEVGSSRLQPAAKAPRNTILRDGTSASSVRDVGRGAWLPGGAQLASRILRFMSISFRDSEKIEASRLEWVLPSGNLETTRTVA
jgi:hypothetical protein